MFAIRLRGIILDIAPGSSLQLEIVSTVMNESDELLGSHSWPVMCPFSEKNKAAFNNAHLPENRKARKTEDALLIIFGSPYKTVKLNYNVTPKGFDCDLMVDLTEISKRIKESELPDAFIVKDKGIFSDFVWIQNGNTKAESLAKLADSNTNVGKYPFVFFPVMNELSKGEIQSQYYVNTYSAGAYFEPMEEWRRDEWFYTPFFYLTWVIKEVCSYLGFEAEGDLFTDPDIIQKVIFNTGSLDYETFFHAEGLKIAPARHLPKIKITDFFKALKAAPLHIATDFNATTKTARFTFKKDILTAETCLNISKHGDLKTLSTFGNEPAQYKLNTKIDSGDEVYKLFPYVTSYLIGEGKETKPQEMGFGTVAMKMSENFWRVPFVRQIANIYSDRVIDTPAYNNPTEKAVFSKNAFGFRLLDYKGMEPDSLGSLYPYASSDRVNSLGVEEYETSCQPMDLLNRYSLSWYTFLGNTERHEITADLPKSEFEKTDPFKKIAYQSETQAIVGCVFDRISIAANAKKGLIACKYILYPHFNIEGLNAPTITVVAPGDQSAALQIWAKLVIDEWTVTDRSRKREKRANGRVLFFLDEGATTPYVVSDFTVKLIRHYRGMNSFNFKDEVFWYSGLNGSDVLLFNDHRSYYFKRITFGTDELETYTWSLEVDNTTKYKAINEGEELPVR